MSCFLCEVSVVVPVYIGENTVEELSKRLISALQSITPDYEIILVNDASPDDSWQKIICLCQNNKQIKGINLSRNFGQHAAISAGLKYAFGKKIVVMDCDLQDLPEDLPRLWAKSQEGYDIVMARRTLRKDGYWKQFLSWSFHQILSLKRGKKTDPAIANFAMYDRKVVEEYYANNPNKIFSIFNLRKDYSRAVIDTIQEVSARGKSGYTVSKLFSLTLSFLLPPKEKMYYYIIDETLNVALENYGVKLVPLTGQKIEMVRQWRNDPKISECMEYREYITPEMQKRWFESICNERNYYFIVEYDNKEIGMINAKNIDYKTMTNEGGIFIYDNKYLASDMPFLVSFCMIDFTENVLEMKRGIAHILRNNKQSIEFNKALGYVLQPGQENVENQLYYLEKENYHKQRAYIKKVLSI